MLGVQAGESGGCEAGDVGAQGSDLRSAQAVDLLGVKAGKCGRGQGGHVGAQGSDLRSAQAVHLLGVQAAQGLVVEELHLVAQARDLLDGEAVHLGSGVGCQLGLGGILGPHTGPHTAHHLVQHVQGEFGRAGSAGALGFKCLLVHVQSSGCVSERWPVDEATWAASIGVAQAHVRPLHPLRLINSAGRRMSHLPVGLAIQNAKKGEETSW